MRLGSIIDGWSRASIHKRIDWRFLKSASASSLAFSVGRVLGFLFTLVVASTFSTEAYGYVTYAIALAVAMATLTTALLQHVLPYHMSKFADTDELSPVMSTLWTMAAGLAVVSALVGSVVLGLVGRFDPAILVVFAGTVLFYGYWGLSTGLLSPGRFVVAYIGSNVCQLIVVLPLVYLLGVRSTGPVIVIYGLAYFLPIAVLSWLRPLPPHFGLSFEKALVQRIARFAGPVWGSSILFRIQSSAPVLMLEYYFGVGNVGTYGLTATLVQVFGFVSQGLSLILAPKLAAMRGGRRTLIMVSVAAALAVNGVGLILFLAVYGWFVQSFFAPDYFLGLGFASVMAVGAILHGLVAVMSQTFIGLGRPGNLFASRMAIAVVVLLGGLVLIPQWGPEGAAWAVLFSGVAGLVVYLLAGLRLALGYDTPGEPTRGENGLE